MSVTISSTIYWSDWPYPADATFQVRAQSDKAWVANDLQFVPAHESRVVGTGTITALRPTLPAITLPATSAGLTDQTARWTVTLHRTGRKQVVSTVLDDFPLPVSFEPTVTWAQIKINKNGKQPLRDTSVYTKTEVNHQIALAVGDQNYAGTSPAYGITALSVAPVSASNPIAVGDNDPRLGGGGSLNVTNVTDAPYSADNTGTVSARTAIVTAYAAAVAAGTKKIYMPAGTYLLTAADWAATGHQLYIIDPDVEWFGDGIGKTIIKIAENTTYQANDAVVLIVDAPRAHIHDFTIQGPNAYTANDYPVGISLRALDPYVHDVEIVNFSGPSASGNSGAIGVHLNVLATANEIATTLGTTIVAGTRTVTPASMVGIYVGRKLLISGTSEYVNVTAVTATTFTAVFVNNHVSTDAVTAIGEGRQNAKTERLFIHDCPYATAFLVDSQGNFFYRNKILRVGGAVYQHGFYIHKGGGIYLSNWIEGVGGYSFHQYGGSQSDEQTANRFEDNDSINPGTAHFVVVNNTNDGTLVSIPTSALTNRVVIFKANRFVSTAGNGVKGGTTGDSGDAGVPTLFIGNYLENSIAIFGDYSIVTNNELRGLNMPQAGWGLRVRDYGILADNVAIGVNTTSAGSNEAPFIAGNYSNVHHNTIIGGNYLHAIYASGIQNSINFNQVRGYAAGTITSGKAFGVGSATGDVEISHNSVDGNAQMQVVMDIEAGGANPGIVRFNNNKVTNLALSSSRAILGQPTTHSGLDFWDNDIPQLGSLTRRSGRLWAAGANVSTDVNPYELVGLDTNNRLTNILTSDTRFFGVFVGPNSFIPNGTNDNALCFAVYEVGAEVTVKCDTAWTRGNVGIISSGTARRISDTGAVTVPAAPASYVIFLDSGGSAGNAKVRLMRTY